MSYKFLAWAVEQDVPSTHAFAILCALAGYANENGECWPSQSALAKKTKQTDRSVRNQLQSLINSGHIQRVMVAGRRGLRLVSNRNIVPISQNQFPAQNPELHSNGAEPNSKTPEPGSGPSEPVSEPVRKQRKKQTKQPDVVDVPDWMPSQAWDDFCAHRGDGFSPRAKRIAIKHLDEWRQNGHDPGRILEVSTMNGWTGLFEPKGNKNGKPTHNAKSNPHANLFAGFGVTDLE